MSHSNNTVLWGRSEGELWAKTGHNMIITANKKGSLKSPSITDTRWEPRVIYNNTS